MKFVCTKNLILMAVLTFQFWPNTANSENLTRYFSTPGWAKTRDFLFICQGNNPRAFTPLEWIRWDFLPMTFLLDLEKRASAAIEKLEGLKNSRVYPTKKIEESCDLNDFLYRKGRKLVESSGGLWLGNMEFFVSLLPNERRLSLTPFDLVFLQNSEVGKKINVDLEKLKSRGKRPLFSSVDLEKKFLFFMKKKVKS